MRHYEFVTRRWARTRDEEYLLDCAIVSLRHGWNCLGYEVRLHARNQLLYRSRRLLTRRLAEQEADALLRDVVSGIRGVLSGAELSDPQRCPAHFPRSCEASIS